MLKQVRVENIFYSLKRAGSFMSYFGLILYEKFDYTSNTSHAVTNALTSHLWWTLSQTLDKSSTQTVAKAQFKRRSYHEPKLMTSEKTALLSIVFQWLITHRLTRISTLKLRLIQTTKYLAS